jgi:hypothetical protein
MGYTGYPSPYTMGTPRRARRDRFRSAILLGFCLALAPQSISQTSGTFQSVDGQTIYGIPAGPDSVRGTVINSKTHEPIARAVVYSHDNRYATLTDDRGHFEFKFPPQAIVAVEDAWGMEWMQPGVLSRYAQHGQELTIGPLMRGTVHLPDPVEVQPK